MLKDEFSDVKEYKDIEAARAAPDLKAIFEPTVENYSFVTARETGGRYYAVTIRYRINVYSPAGEKVDSLTLTGYGNALAKGISSGKPLQMASVAAMRDAAAKFLVQFPDLSMGERLARNEARDRWKRQGGVLGRRRHRDRADRRGAQRPWMRRR